MLKRGKKAGVEFLSGESRERLIMPPDYKDDCVTGNNRRG
jgi:hypothetical protein